MSMPHSRSRRQLLQASGALGGSVLAGLLLAGCDKLPVTAAPRPKVARLGILSPGTPAGASEMLVFIRQGLPDRRYVEGQHFTLEARFAEGQADRLPALAAE